ncbi:MAG TPA: hypothetical protein VFH59_09885 [Frateuria sp.]|uniref:hypothetical protein n=1 Tax=Frateuria sp. TaxID=2211372 RepID=UPI002D7E8E45|nr:hypothetical protein [Frateuria sp.]HET6805737.1 hypothetical protein [Frateuria sp.]
MARKNAQPEAPNEPHPALAILEEIEAKLKHMGDVNKHVAAWVKAKVAEAKSKL